MHDLRDVQHSLGRDAAYVETGATEILFLDDCNLCAKLRSPDGGDIATGTRTNYCYVIVCVFHDLILLACCFDCFQYSTSRVARSALQVRIPRYYYFCNKKHLAQRLIGGCSMYGWK